MSLIITYQIKMTKKRDEFGKNWIIEKALGIIQRYEDGVLTIRGLHYQLVGEGMPNTQRHYKRVVNSMISARRDQIVGYSVFSDRDREMESETEADHTDVDYSIIKGRQQISAWMNNYQKNRWENQPIYPEVLIEKKALVGTFEKKCREWDIGLGACKGYPSLTFLHDMSMRFGRMRDEGKECVILYFGDYDPSGEDIPRSIEENLKNDFDVEVEVRVISLNEEQVLNWDLPPAPAKIGDSRTANWDGLGQVELDAVSPDRINRMLDDAILGIFDYQLHDQLLEIEEEEREQYRRELKDYVNRL